MRSVKTDCLLVFCAHAMYLQYCVYVNAVQRTLCFVLIHFSFSSFTLTYLLFIDQFVSASANVQSL